MQLNPNHPVTRSMGDQWHKIVALMLSKLESKEIIITEVDILKLDNNSAVTVQELPDGLHVKLISMEEGQRLARQHGGLPL